MKNVYNYHIREKNLTCTSKQTAVQTRRCLSALLDGRLWRGENKWQMKIGIEIKYGMMR